LKLKTWKDVRELIKAGNSLRLRCGQCRKEFYCSGFCIFERSESYGDNIRAFKRECICIKCDTARPKWTDKCMKEFPWGWILRNGKKRNRSSESTN